MTDLTPSPEAVEAAAKALNEAACICRTGRNQYGGWYSPQPTCPRCGDNDTKARVALEAALPHLRPLVEAQELRLATEVALKLGRQEALEEVRQGMSLGEDWQIDDPRISYVSVQVDKDTYRQIMAARDTGKGGSA